MIRSHPPLQSFRPYPKAAQHKNLWKPAGWVDNERRVAPTATANDGGSSLEFMLPEEVNGKRRINYDVMMLHGKRGDGNSAGATLLAKQMRRAWDAMGCKNKIYANYHITFADIMHPRLVDEIVQFPDWCHDCLIVIDELASYFPSLRSTSREALLWQTFLQQIRKLHISLLFTTQYPTYVGAGSNIQINWYIKPFGFNRQYDKRVGAYVPDSMRFDIVDWWGSQTGIAVQHRWPPWPTDVSYSRTFHNISEIYSEYDTDEVIPPYFAPGREKIIYRGWKDEIEAEKANEEEIAQALAVARKAIQTNKDEPASIEEALTKLGDKFRVDEASDALRHFDKSLQNYNAAGEFLTGKGYVVFMQGNSKWARKR